MEAAPLGRTIRTLEATTNSLLSEFQSSLVLVKLIAEDLEKHNENSEQVQNLKAATLQLISYSNQLDRHRQVMESLSNTYTNRDEETDFENVLKEEIGKFPSFDAKSHPYYKQFEEAIWNVHHAGIPLPGQEQAEILITSQARILNTTCPLSGKPVIELHEPVRSTECRHIYERQVVMQYMRRKHDIQCAAAGCPKRITAQNLVCDQSLLLEIEELRRRGATETQTHVADCTELDEDE